LDRLAAISVITFGLLIPVSLRAQATLQGTVTDSSGALVPNAQVTLTDASRTSLKSTTDPKGVNKKETIPFTPSGMAGTVAGTGFIETNIKWSINGYLFGNMPMPTMNKGDRVRWYVATLGDFNNAHTPHWHGNTVLVAGQRTDVLVVTSANMVTADMVPDVPGIWLYHCHISDHMLAGMVARYEVK